MKSESECKSEWSDKLLLEKPQQKSVGTIINNKSKL